MEKTLVILVLIGIVATIGYAQSRFDTCKAHGHKTIGCVFSLD